MLNITESPRTYKCTYDEAIELLEIAGIEAQPLINRFNWHKINPNEWENIQIDCYMEEWNNEKHLIINEVNFFYHNSVFFGVNEMDGNWNFYSAPRNPHPIQWALTGEDKCI